MHVELHDTLGDDDRAKKASELISACVHCGFCLATCPTYLDNGDERDSPRGRIYLVKQLLEQGDAGAITRNHLDRCLTCRSCETTCPSGMQYGELVDLGRSMVEEKSPRPLPERTLRRALRAVLRRPRLFGALLRVGQWLRPLIPDPVACKVPRRQQPGTWPEPRHTRRMLVLAGCVQSAATPRTNAAAARVLDRLGISLVEVPRAGCCGALDYHLGAHAEGLDAARRNIDAWWPELEAGAEAVVSCASGCGAMLADYGALLADDPDYSTRAERVSAAHRDLAEALDAEDLAALALTPDAAPVAVHLPCSQQHALGHAGLVSRILTRAGFTLAATRDDHLCCGSAGTYSLLQTDISGRLRKRKLAALCAGEPGRIVTANVGCQLHLSEASAVPVNHWIEMLDPAPPGH
jgi:glycolate oxidase iron-sulfur subunit